MGQRGANKGEEARHNLRARRGGAQHIILGTGIGRVMLPGRVERGKFDAGPVSRRLSREGR